VEGCSYRLYLDDENISAHISEVLVANPVVDLHQIDMYISFLQSGRRQGKKELVVSIFNR